MNTASNRLKLALAQMNPTVGDLAGNALAIVRTAQEAAALGADLVLFPEMALTGYPPEDLILVPAFRQAAWDAARQIAKDTQSLPCDLIFGNLWEESEPAEPAMSPRSGAKGRSEVRSVATKNIYNASVLASGGRLSLLRAKHALPNYGVFDEMRVFAPGPEPEVVEWRGLKLGLLICEEVWQPGAGVALAQAGAELLLVQNASPYHIGKASERKAVVDAVVKATGLPLVYLNLVGGQDELVFDGRSYAVGADGADAARLPAFRESLAVLHYEKRAGGWVCVDAPMEPVHGDEETIYHALVLGLRDYVRKNGFPGVVLGLSGGIDSALSAAIAVDALGADKVLGLRLPSPYSSTDSLEDAQALAELLGIQTHTVSIQPGMEAARAALAPLFAGRAPDTTEENIQARLRGLTLMAVSNKFGHMLLTTGNKSEMSVGYATLYGDMAGGFSVLKDVYKTTVTRLSSWRNGFADGVRLGLLGPAGPVMPERSITKPPSAELRPDQKDEDSLPPYAVLDTVLRGLIERQLSVHELIAEGMEAVVVEKVAKLVWAAEYKRRQSAPGVKITPMAFGRDRRWPITNRWKFQ